MKKFEVGKTYSATSIGDHNCIWIFKVTARTESTITIEEKGGETKKHRINKEVSENRGSESVFPFGRYSMCPILSADHEEPVEKTKELTENEVRTVLAVFDELRKMPYDKLNTFLGSITIEEMNQLNEKLNGWYQGEVLGKEYSEEFGWYDPIF